jgi:23S rRNA pseudouridine1911/1915/1917 synthase
MRLDKFVAGAIPSLSRQRVQALIGDGQVELDGVTAAAASARLRTGQEVVVRVPPATPAEPAPEAIPLDIVFEDPHLVVVDKPAGLVVHPAPGSEDGTLVNALLGHFGDTLSGIGGVKRPGIVHRLDKDTSGLMVVAKTDTAHRGLAEQFAAHGADGRLERSYVAVVWGVPARRRGRIEGFLGRSPTNRRKMAVVDEAHGRYAATRYQVVRVFGSVERPLGCLVRLQLETGRTHQIRVHMASIGHPLLGDVSYGAGHKASARHLAEQAQAALAELGRQALHACVLGFEHPVTGERLRFDSDIPEDLAALIDALPWLP